MAFSKFDLHKEGCGVEIPTNARPALSNFYVDRSRLRVSEEHRYLTNVKSGANASVDKRKTTASIMDNARMAAGAMAARSSFSNNEDRDGREGGWNNDPLGGNNPLNKRRGDEFNE